MKIEYLVDKWPWFGQHQCYGRLAEYVGGKGLSVNSRYIKYDMMERIMGKLYLLLSGQTDRRDTVFAAAEAKYPSLFSKVFREDTVYHVLFFDTHFRFFDRLSNIPENLIATIHHPIGRVLPVGMEHALEKLSSALVFDHKAVPFFENYVGKGRVKFVRHGVDTSFFTPPRGSSRDKVLFFCGQNGRDLRMTADVFLDVRKKYPDVSLDILVPDSIKNSREFSVLRSFPGVNWYSSMTESEVREKYRESYLLFLPLVDSGVNNAVLEAISCGLPVVTTDVGGIRDYGGGEVFPVVGKNDDEAMVALIARYLDEPEWRDDISNSCRNFAVENLDWTISAREHVEVYRSLCDRGTFAERNNG